MKLPKPQRVSTQVNDEILCPGCRFVGTVKVGRKHSEDRVALLKALHGCGQPCQHLGAIGRTGVCSDEERQCWVEVVEGKVVCVRPDGHLWIVWEICKLESISMVTSGGVRGRRHRDTLKEWRAAADSELTQHPALGYRVKAHDWITIVIRLAGSAEPRPQVVARYGTVQPGSSLTEDLK